MSQPSHSVPADRRPSASVGMSSSVTLPRLGGILATQRRTSLAQDGGLAPPTPAEDVTSRQPSANGEDSHARMGEGSPKPRWMEDLRQTVRRGAHDRPTTERLNPPAFVQEIQQLGNSPMRQQQTASEMPAWKRNLLERRRQEGNQVTDQANQRPPVARGHNNNNHRTNDDEVSLADSLADKPEFIRKQRQMNFCKEEAILEACGRLDVESQTQINQLLREGLATKVKHYNQAFNSIRIVRHTPTAYQQGLYRPPNMDSHEAGTQAHQDDDDSDSDGAADSDGVQAQHEASTPGTRAAPWSKTHKAFGTNKQRLSAGNVHEKQKQIVPPVSPAPEPLNSSSKAQQPHPTTYQQTLIEKFRKILAGKLDDETRTQVEALLMEALVEEAVLRDQETQDDEDHGHEQQQNASLAKYVHAKSSSSTGSLSSLSTTRSVPQQSQPSLLEQRLGKSKTQLGPRPEDDEGSLAGKPEFLKKFRRMNFAKDEYVLEASGCNVLVAPEDRTPEGADAVTPPVQTNSFARTTTAVQTYAHVPATTKLLNAASATQSGKSIDHPPVSGPLHSAHMTSVTKPSTANTSGPERSISMQALTNDRPNQAKPEFLRKFDKMNFKKEVTVLESSGKRVLNSFSSIETNTDRSNSTNISATFIAKANVLAAGYEKEVNMKELLLDPDDVDQSAHNEAAEYIKARTLQALMHDDGLADSERQLASLQLVELLSSDTEMVAVNSDRIEIRAQDESQADEPEWRQKFRQMKSHKVDTVLRSDKASLAKILPQPVLVTRTSDGKPTQPRVSSNNTALSSVDSRDPIAPDKSPSVIAAKHSYSVQTSPIRQKPIVPSTPAGSDGKPEWMKKFDTMQFNKDETVLEAGGSAQLSEKPNNGSKGLEQQSSPQLSKRPDELQVGAEAKESFSLHHSPPAKVAGVQPNDPRQDASKTGVVIDSGGVVLPDDGNNQLLDTSEREEMSLAQDSRFSGDDGKVTSSQSGEKTSKDLELPSSKEPEVIASFGEFEAQELHPEVSDTFGTGHSHDETSFGDAFDAFGAASLGDHVVFGTTDAFDSVPEQNRDGCVASDVFEDAVSGELEVFGSDFGTFQGSNSKLPGNTLGQLEDNVTDFPVSTVSPKMEPPETLSRNEPPGAHLSETLPGNIEKAERKEVSRNTRSSSSGSEKHLGKASSNRSERREHSKRSPTRTVRKGESTSDKSRRRSSNESSSQTHHEGRRERRSSRFGDEQRERRMSRSGNETSRPKGEGQVDSEQTRQDRGKSRPNHHRRHSMDEKTTCSRSSMESRCSLDAATAFSGGQDAVSQRRSSTSSKDIKKAVNGRVRTDKTSKGTERSDRSVRDDRSRRTRDDCSVYSKDERSVRSRESHSDQRSRMKAPHQTSSSLQRESSVTMHRSVNHATLTEISIEGRPFDDKDRKRRTNRDGSTASATKSPERMSRRRSKTVPKDSEELMKFLHASVNDLASKKKGKSERSSSSRGQSATNKADQKGVGNDKEPNFSSPVLPMDFTDFEDDDNEVRTGNATAFDDPWGQSNDSNGKHDFEEFDFDDGFGHADGSEANQSDGFSDLHMSQTSEIFVDPTQLTRTTMTPVLPSKKKGEFDMDFGFSPTSASTASERVPPGRGLSRTRSTDLSPATKADKERSRKGRKSTSRLTNSMSAFDSSAMEEFTVNRVSAQASPPSSPVRSSDKKSRDRSRKKKDTVFDTYDWTMS